MHELVRAQTDQAREFFALHDGHRSEFPMKMFKYALIVTLLVFGQVAHAKSFDENILLVPAGDVDTRVVEAIKARLSEALPMDAKIEIMDSQKIPESSYDGSRRQYSAEAILSDISQKVYIDKRNETLIIICDVDLFAPQLDFVLGIANIPEAACIMSLVRLKNEFYGLKPDERSLRERAVKEAFHELGRVWGAGDCTNRRCAMYPSNKISDIDKKRTNFCYFCDRVVHRRRGEPLLNKTMLNRI